MKLVEHREGGTRLLVPAASLEVSPPPTSPVFFNPAASLNRDITVAVTQATEGTSFCDSMAGVGARGLRVSREVARIERVTMVDFNGDALKIARQGAALNRVARKCEFAQSETSSYLFSRYGREKRFDYVDVDPFGSPIAQVQGALSATADGGVLSLTATDTAVLCGVYPKVAKRRYGGAPLNNVFSHETAIRLLAGAVAKVGASLEVGTQPMAAHSTRHYVRLFVRVHAGAQRADSALVNLGHISWCTSCGHLGASAEPEASCPACGRKQRIAGPLWIGKLTDPEVALKAEKIAGSLGFDRARGVLAALGGSDDYPPWSFSIERACSALKVATVPEEEVWRALRRSGFGAMRTPYEKTGVRTNASYTELLDAVREAAAGRGRRIATSPQTTTSRERPGTAKATRA